MLDANQTLRRIEGLLGRSPEHLADEGRRLEVELGQAAVGWLSGRQPEQLAMAEALSVAGAAVGFSARIAALCVTPVVIDLLAGRYLREASCALASAAVRAPVAPAAPAASASFPEPALWTVPTVPDAPGLQPSGLANIARAHRSHERYYTQYMAESAASLLRNANRLRVLCEAWETSEPSAATTPVDQRYGVMGCDDLNARQAIATIGILFMEGEGEPSEIVGLKAMLRGAAPASSGAAQWLRAKMEVTLSRERSLLIAGPNAVVRLLTVAANWCGTQELALTGRLLGVALSALDRVDFQPAALRLSKAAAKQELTLAAAAMCLAARQQQRFSMRMTETDAAWTRHLELLDDGHLGS